MEKEDGGHSVAIDPAERLLLSLSHTDETQDEPAEEPQYDGRADEAPLLAHGAEDEVGALFRNEVVFGLRSLQVSFPEETSGAYRYFGLIDIVSPLLRVAFHAEQVQDTFLLMELHMVENSVHDLGEGNRTDEHSDAYQNVLQFRPPGIDADRNEREARGGEQASVEAGLSPGEQGGRQIDDGRDERHGGQIPHLVPPFSVHEPFDEGTDNDDRREQRRRVPEEGEDEEEDHHPQCDVNPRIETFAVEDDEKRGEHDGRTGVVLEQDDGHGGRQQEHCVQPAPPVGHGKAVGAHVTSEGECRRKFGELGGLHGESAEAEPRFRAVDLRADEERCQQYREHEDVGGVGEDVVVDFVNQHDDHRCKYADAHPYQLGTVTRVHGKSCPGCIVEHCGIDVQPAEEHQRKEYRHRTPVDAVAGHAVVSAAACHSRDRIWSCSSRTL